MANRDHSLDDGIIQAAYSEFLAYGFQKASLHKIADRAINAEEQVYFRLLTEHHDDCTLFFCRSDGSSIETVLHELMDQKAEQTVEFFSHIYGKTPNADAIRLLMGSQFWYFRQLSP